ERSHSSQRNELHVGLPCASRKSFDRSPGTDCSMSIEYSRGLFKLWKLPIVGQPEGTGVPAVYHAEGTGAAVKWTHYQAAIPFPVTVNSFSLRPEGGLPEVHSRFAFPSGCRCSRVSRIRRRSPAVVSASNVSRRVEAERA